MWDSRCQLGFNIMIRPIGARPSTYTEASAHRCNRLPNTSHGPTPVDFAQDRLNVMAFGSTL